MFRIIFRLLRVVVAAVLGTAVAAKLLLESNAEPTTEEIDLVSIFEGQHLSSEASPFYGGKVMTMFGGVMLDLRKATPAPTGIYLDLAVVFGGVSLIVPEGWRVRFEGKLMAGGFSDATRTTADDDVPTVTVTGFVALGGVQATNKSPVQAST
jgi:predicted membrane protein